MLSTKRKRENYYYLTVVLLFCLTKRPLGFVRGYIFCHFDEPPVGGEEKSLRLFDKKPFCSAQDDNFVISTETERRALFYLILYAK